MKKFKEKIGGIDKELFNKINQLLLEHGIKNAEVTSLKLKNVDPGISSCAPGKILYCWTTVEGKRYCKCI